MTSGPVCITCGDVAVPMRVVRTGLADGLAECVTADGRASEVDLGVVGEVRPGDEVLVHACVAIQRLQAGRA